MRWSAKGKGKRGGVRTIYYFARGVDQIWMVFVYAKNEAESLTAAQKKLLHAIVERW